MKQFEIILKNDKRKHYNRIAFLFILINLVLFIYLAFTAAEKNYRSSSALGAILIVLLLGIDFFLQRTRQNKGFPYRIAAATLIIFFTWWQLNNWWIGILCAVLGFLYQVAIRPLPVIVNKYFIRYPSAFSRKIKWEECLNVILKDGLLTIDLKNNHILQQPVEENNSINEAEFSDFCRQQMNK